MKKNNILLLSSFFLFSSFLNSAEKMLSMNETKQLFTNIKQMPPEIVAKIATYVWGNNYLSDSDSVLVVSKNLSTCNGPQFHDAGYQNSLRCCDGVAFYRCVGQVLSLFPAVANVIPRDLKVVGPNDNGLLFFHSKMKDGKSYRIANLKNTKKQSCLFNQTTHQSNLSRIGAWIFKKILQKYVIKEADNVPIATLLNISKDQFACCLHPKENRWVYATAGDDIHYPIFRLFSLEDHSKTVKLENSIYVRKLIGKFKFDLKNEKCLLASSISSLLEISFATNNSQAQPWVTILSAEELNNIEDLKKEKEKIEQSKKSSKDVMYKYPWEISDFEQNKQNPDLFLIKVSIQDFNKQVIYKYVLFNRAKQFGQVIHAPVMQQLSFNKEADFCLLRDHYNAQAPTHQLNITPVSDLFSKADKVIEKKLHSSHIVHLLNIHARAAWPKPPKTKTYNLLVNRTLT